MTSVKTMVLVVLVMTLAGYAVHMNMKLNKTVSQYEMSATEMAGRFEKVNEDALKAREELARQMITSEKAGAAIEAAKAEVAKVMSALKQAPSGPVEAAPAEPVIVAEKKQPLSKEQASSNARAKAEKAMAEAEALLGRIGDKPNVWEERSAHL